MTALRDPWAVLGLPRSSSPAQAERAYRRLAERHHPDRAAHDPAAQTAAAAHMVELNEAIDAVRAGTAPAGPNAGWWDGEAPGGDTDWFGKPIDDNPAAASDNRPPLSCALCDERFTSADALRSHLIQAHEGLLSLRVRRGQAPLLDRLDTLAWRTPIWLAGLLALVVGLAVSGWMQSWTPDGSDWELLAHTERGRRLAWYGFLPVYLTVAVVGSLTPPSPGAPPTRTPPSAHRRSSMPTPPGWTSGAR